MPPPRPGANAIPAARPPAGGPGGADSAGEGTRDRGFGSRDESGRRKGRAPTRRVGPAPSRRGVRRRSVRNPHGSRSTGRGTQPDRRRRDHMNQRRSATEHGGVRSERRVAGGSPPPAEAEDAVPSSQSPHWTRKRKWPATALNDIRLPRKTRPNRGQLNIQALLRLYEDRVLRGTPAVIIGRLAGDADQTASDSAAGWPRRADELRDRGSRTDPRVPSPAPGPTMAFGYRGLHP